MKQGPLRVHHDGRAESELERETFPPPEGGTNGGAPGYGDHISRSGASQFSRDHLGGIQKNWLPEFAHCPR